MEMLVFAGAAVVKIAVVMGVVLLTVAFLTLAERKVLSWMQDRMGPMEVGPYGILQPLADGIKLFFKEDIVPSGANRLLFSLAPILSLVPAFIGFAVVPYGPNRGETGRVDPELERHRHGAWGRHLVVVPRDPDRRLRRVRHLGRGGDEPPALRPAGGRKRAGGRLDDRIQRDALRLLLHGGIREHDPGLLHRLGPVPRWVPRPVPRHPAPSQSRLDRGSRMVHGEGVRLLVPVLLAPRHAAAPAVRPTHALRVEEIGR